MSTTFPLVITNRNSTDLASWVACNASQLGEQITIAGALLFRGFDVGDPRQFAAFVAAATPGALPYTERSSPRREVLANENIYTSTQYPEERAIFLHNEQSYNLRFPRFICFCCLQPATEGGQTPIADTRRILQRLNPATVRTLHARKYCYARSFDGAFGLPWQTAFQLRDWAELERYCADNGIEIDADDSRKTLRTRQVREVIARHPKSGELCWFNHLTFFHLRTQEPDIADMLRQMYPDASQLPNATYYGDGTDIDAGIIDELRTAYAAESVAFDWQRGDVLLLDNMLTAHGRSAYCGDREVVTAMADPLDWSVVAVRDERLF